MSDISKCRGIGCDKKDKCYRYTCEGSTFQSYFQPDVVDCEYFIDNEEMEIKLKKYIDEK